MSHSGNGGSHKTPVPASNSAAGILRKIEGLPDDLRALDPYQLAAFAAFSVLESTERLEALVQEVRATNILDRTTAQRVHSLDAQVVAALEQHAEIRRDIAAIRAEQATHASGIMEAIGKAESAKREAMASDVDLAQTVEREREAREVADERMRQLLAPVIADASRKAGNAGAAKTAGAMSVAALVTGLAAQPVETIKLLREIGPAGAGISVVLLLVALMYARRNRS